MNLVEAECCGMFLINGMGGLMHRPTMGVGLQSPGPLKALV